MKKVILASASPRRKELLGKINIPFEVKTCDTDETITEINPSLVVETLSYRKADALTEDEPDALIIGADTVVAFQDTILGKPKEKEDAAAMLRALQGSKHQVYTGVTAIWRNGGTKEFFTFHERTDVEVYPMTEEEIYRYIETGEPMDKAGSYGIQGLFSVYVRSICGDYNNVVGLPVARLYQELKQRGLIENKEGADE